jgi:hypothetical protein
MSITAATARAVEARREAAVAEAQPPAQASGDMKTAFLDEVRKVKKFFYGTVIAQAQRIDVETDRIVFVFAPQHKALRGQLDQSRATLEDIAGRLAGRRMAIVSAEGNAPAATSPVAVASEPQPVAQSVGDRQSDLKQQALADSGVQAMLDVFAAEIRDVEER